MSQPRISLNHGLKTGVVSGGSGIVVLFHQYTRQRQYRSGFTAGELHGPAIGGLSFSEITQSLFRHTQVVEDTSAIFIARVFRRTFKLSARFIKPVFTVQESSVIDSAPGITSIRSYRFPETLFCQIVFTFGTVDQPHGRMGRSVVFVQLKSAIEVVPCSTKITLPYVRRG